MNKEKTWLYFKLQIFRKPKSISHEGAKHVVYII